MRSRARRVVGNRPHQLGPGDSNFTFVIATGAQASQRLHDVEGLATIGIAAMAFPSLQQESNAGAEPAAGGIGRGNSTIARSSRCLAVDPTLRGAPGRE
jgi:hypothetical protein